jgi:threonine dehydratase
MPVLVILLGHFNSLNAVIGEVDDQSRFLKQQLAVASGLPVKSWLRRRLTTYWGESGFQRECRISRAAARSCQRLLGIQIVFPEGSQVADGSAEVSRINIQLNRWVALSAAMPTDYLERILNAQVYDVAIETPLDFAPACRRVSATGCCSSAKICSRFFPSSCAALTTRSSTSRPRRLKRGVICASAGNHAQGVALAAAKVGCRAVIVMPTTTPQIKMQAVQARGGEVVLAGESYDDAYAHALELEKSEKLSFVHPFDDPEVIAGQGTIGMEILRQHAKPIHAVFCCVGGGGLISGVAAYIKRVRPETRIVGVEAVDADAMTRSLPPASASGSTMSACSPMARRSSTSARRPSASVRCTSMKWCWWIPTPSVRRSRTSSRTPARCSNRPARWRSPVPRNTPASIGLKDKTLIATASGANLNFDRLRFVAERAEIGEQREAVFAVTLPERPGAYKRFVALIGSRNITEFNYRYNDQRDAHVFVGIQVASRAESMRLLEHLRKHDYPTLDLTDDEMAKGHIRHLVGGHSPGSSTRSSTVSSSPSVRAR